MESRPLVGVTTSEVRRAERTQPLPEGEPPQHEMALGMPYVRALARAGAVPVVLPPLPVEAVPVAAGAAARRLPVRRAGPRPERLRRVALAGPRAGRARAGRLRARGRARRRRAWACRSSASAVARRRSTSRAAGRCTSTCRRSPTTRSTHRQTAPGWAETHEVRVEPGLAAGLGPGPRALGRELVPPPGRRPARRGPARGGVGAGRDGRGHRGRGRAVRAGRAVARGDARQRARTRGCSRRWSPPRPASRLDLAA